MEGSAVVVGVLLVAVLALAVAVVGLVVALTRGRLGAPELGPPGRVHTAQPPQGHWAAPLPQTRSPQRTLPRVNEYGELDD